MSSSPPPEWNDGWSEDGKIDYYDKFVTLIMNDDKEGVYSLEAYLGEKFNVRIYTAEQLLGFACQFDAVKCATALLDDNGMEVNESIESGGPPLHVAAMYLSPGIVDLLLDRGAQTDIRLDTHTDSLLWEHNGLTPLNIALVQTSNFARVYSPGKSTFQFIVSLCIHGLAGRLSTVELLAWDSDDLEEVAYNHAMEGNVIELAVLLLVAPKGLVSVQFHKKDGAGLDRTGTLHQFVLSQIRSLFDHLNFSGEHECGKLARKLVVMRSIEELLEVFERAGHIINDFWGSLQSQRDSIVSVEKALALRLEEAGFKLKDGDFDFSRRDWFGVRSWDGTRTPTKYLKTPSEKSFESLSRDLLFMQQTNVLSHSGLRKKELLGNTNWLARSISPLHKTGGLSSNKVPKSISGYPYSTSLNAEVKNRSKALEKNMPKCLSMQRLQCIAKLIKRGIRSA